MKARHTYASFLEIGSRIGLYLSIAAFFVYVLGLLPAYVDTADIDRYWSLPLADYVAATGIPTGPGAWLSMLGTGDGLAALPVVLLSLLSLAAYVMIALPHPPRPRSYLRRFHRGRSSTDRRDGLRTHRRMRRMRERTDDWVIRIPSSSPSQPDRALSSTFSRRGRRGF